MAKGTCSVEGCDSEVYRRGMCSRDYRATLAVKADRCSEDDCGKPVVGRGLCARHHRRWCLSVAPECSVDDCHETAARRGWCNSHYNRWRQHGDPLYVDPAKPPEGFKVCCECGETKPLESFATKPFGDGKRTRASGCMDCLRVAQALYRREHGDRVNGNARKGYAVNPARKKSSKTAFRQRHHERLLAEARRKYRETAAERPEIFRAANARRKQRLKVRMDATDRALSVAYRMAIRNDPCFYCKRRPSGDMHDDHFFPLAKGGTDHWWNLVRACPKCNLTKNARCGTWFLLMAGGSREPRRAPAVA